MSENIDNRVPDNPDEKELQQQEKAERAQRDTIVSQTIPGMDAPMVKPGDASGHRKGQKSTTDEDLN